MRATRFAGFPDRLTFVPVPTVLFGSLLRDIDSLAELKATLHIWRLLQQQRKTPRFVQRSHLLADRELLMALQSGAASASVEVLQAALERAVERGTLLAVPVRDGNVDDVCLLLNTANNRKIASEVARGERRLGNLDEAPFATEVAGLHDKTTIYEAYEQNIGVLTPMLAEELREAEQTYPKAWIHEALREAVSRNKRSWRYIQRILENWSASGKGSDGEAGRHPEPPRDSGRYLSGKYGQLVRR